MVRQNLGNDVYQAWADGTQETGRNYSRGNVFFQGATIYSYGYHFPMAYRKDTGEYIVNADTYSSTTSQHQAGVRIVLRDRNQIPIPFSILRGPRIRVADIEIVDTEPDRYPLTGKMHEVRVWNGDYTSYTSTQEPMVTHLLGRSVFRVWRQDGESQCPAYPCPDELDYRTCTHRKYSHHYYLSGTDETMRDPWRSYFLAELPCAVTTVGQAIEALKPDAVGRAEDDGLKVKRQGEWFFIPAPGVLRNASDVVDDRLSAPTGWVTQYLAHRDQDRQRRHVATHLKVKDGQRYVKGTIRHTGQEHKMLNLGKVWHTVHENMEVRSFRGSGRVD